MGFWPFGSHRKSDGHSTSAEAAEAADATDAAGNTLFDNHNAPSTMARRPPTAAVASVASVAAPAPVVATRHATRPADNKSRKLSKARTSTQPVDGLMHPRLRATAAGAGTVRDSDKPADGNQLTSNLYLQNPIPRFSNGPEAFTAGQQATPTLHAKRPDHDTTLRRNKSGKRKADDYARQKEIQAMSAMPRPKRPATYSGTGPLTRDTTTVPGNLNRRLARPASQISLPRQEDIAGHDAAPASFKVGVLSALSPRPVVKYESRQQKAAGKRPAHPVSAEYVIREEDMSHSKTRIDELADTLDSSGIRELLERDRRHRERRKEADRARLQRRLQRRADRQREEEMRRKRVEEFASQSSARCRTEQMPHQTANTVASGSGARVRAKEEEREKEREKERESEPVVINKVPEQADTRNCMAVQDPFADSNNLEAKDIRNPFEDEKDMDVMQEQTDLDDEQSHPIAVKTSLHKAHAEQNWQGAKPAQATLSPPTSPIEAPADTYSFSQTSGTGRKVTPDTVESIDRDAQCPGQPSQNVSSWTSFFKLRGRRKASAADKGRTTPSEFSNTSRESFARKQPPPAVLPPRTFRRSNSAVPQRTLSKFREDLPELPISPPDSRVHSPEAAGSHLSSKHIRPSLSGTIDDKSLATNSSNPALDKQRSDSHPQGAPLTAAGAGAAANAEVNSTSPEHPQPPLARSLASVDSEASWLSGKPVKRSYGAASLSWRHSNASLVHHLPAEMEQEEDDLVQDEYLCQLSPTPQQRQESPAAERKASSVLIDFQNERGHGFGAEATLCHERTDEHWHHGLARQPTVVRHTEAARSREGLLKEFADEDDDDDYDDFSSIGDDSPHIEEGVQLMRARSVDYKGDVKRVSAGSARLLDIRRSSTVSTSRTSGMVQPVELEKRRSSSTPKL